MRANQLVESKREDKNSEHEPLPGYKSRYYQYQKALALLTVGLETGLRVGFAVTGLRVGLGVAQSTDNLNNPSAEL